MEKHTEGKIENINGNLWAGNTVVAQINDQMLSSEFEANRNEAKANAARIVKAWNNWDYVVAQLERIKAIYDTKEDAAGVIAKETLNKIYNL